MAGAALVVYSVVVFLGLSFADAVGALGNSGYLLLLPALVAFGGIGLILRKRWAAVLVATLLIPMLAFGIAAIASSRETADLVLSCFLLITPLSVALVLIRSIHLFTRTGRSNER